MKNRLLRQILMYSKLVFYGFILQCVVAGLLIANDGNAQRAANIRNINISVHFDNDGLMEAFQKIERQTDLTFTFNQSDINQDVKLRKRYSNESLYDVLLEIARDTDLKFKQVNNTINVDKVKKKDKPVETYVLQERTITGRVTGDEDQEGLPGVNVLVKGTNKGTVTDIDGNYSIQVTDENDVLVFSYVGYIPEEIQIGNRSTVNISMMPDIQSLSEVVVIGYGQVQRRDVTGAVSSVKSEEINAVPVLGLDQAIQGRASGVYVANTQSNPGGSVQIRIRGINSIEGNNDPLYIIDGVVGGNINSVAPTDIESIDILKDASSTSIYGARGANGVVIVTTKSGKVGTNQINFDAYYGVQNVINKLDLMNAREHAEFVNELDAAEGQPATFPDVNNLEHDTDWQDELFRTAPMQNYNLSASGGTEKLSYYVSGSFIDQQGIVRNTEYNRYNLRLNLDSKVSDALNIGTRIGFARAYRTLQMGEDFKGGSNTHHPVIGAIELAPSLSPYDVNGELVPELINIDGAQESNPIHHMENNIAHRYNTIINGNVFAELELLKDLKFKTSFGVNFDNSKRNYYKPSIVFEPNDGYRSIAEVNTGIYTDWLSENFLTYRISSGLHNIDLMAGFTAQESNWEGLNVRATDFAVDDFDYHNVGAGDPATDQMGSGMSRTARASFYGRIHYVFNDKYLITVNGRRDGSSIFGEEYKWGFFPSGAVAWRLSEEQFVEDLNFFSDLKLRVSYGVSGSEASAPYLSLSAVSPVQSYILNGSIVNGFRPTRLPNPEYRWEQTAQLDVGLDAGFLDGRINVNIDYYEKTTEDLFLNKPVPQTSGVATVRENIGSLKNSGLEFGVNAAILTGDFKWNADFNITNQTSEITKLVGEDEEIIGGRIGGGLKLGNMSIIKIGEQIGSFYGYQTAGLWQNNDPEFGTALQFGAPVQAGDIKFVDQNGDNDINDADRKVIGHSLPSVYGGFNNNFAYKGFDLSVFVQYSFGNDVLNGVKRKTNTTFSRENKSKDLIDNTWTPENTDAEYPRLGYLEPGLVTDRYLENGSFVRFREITMGYSLPNSLINRVNIERLRVYVSGINLFTLSDYSGYDPEVNMYGGDNVTRLNTDVGSYPRAKSVFFGLNMTF